MFATYLYTSFSHSQIKRYYFEVCLHKVAQFSIISFCTDQHFHPSNTADQNALVTAILCIRLLHSIERVNYDIGVKYGDQLIAPLGAQILLVLHRVDLAMSP